MGCRGGGVTTEDGGGLLLEEEGVCDCGGGAALEDAGDGDAADMIFESNQIPTNKQCSLLEIHMSSANLLNTNQSCKLWLP